MACPRAQEVPQPPGTQDDSQVGGRRSRVDRREMASAARASLYREHGGGTGRKVAAGPYRARSVADGRRYVDAILDFDLYSTVSTSRCAPACTTPPPNLIASVPNSDREDHGRLSVRDQGPCALRHDPAKCPSQGPSAERNYMPSDG